MHLRFLILIAIVCASCTKPVISPNGRLTAKVDGQTINVYYNDPDQEKYLVTDVHVGLVTADADLDNALPLKKVSW